MIRSSSRTYRRAHCRPSRPAFANNLANRTATVLATAGLAAATLIGGAACVEKSRDLSFAQREQLSEHVSTTAPAETDGPEISFENKIVLLGHQAPESVRPGDTFEVTWFWKCETAVDGDWQLFTHITDADDNLQDNADRSGDIRNFYQPGSWKPGEYVRDVQQITIPANWSSPRVNLYLGIWNGPNRLRILRGPNDGDNRGRAASIAVEVSEVDPEVTAGNLPALRAIRTSVAPTIDGDATEPAWATASATSAFVDTMTGAAAVPEARVRALYDDDFLYLAFTVADDDLQSPHEDHDSPLWEQDAVEVFIDSNGNRRDYFEMQVSPRGTIFDTRYDARRQPTAPGHVTWASELRAATTLRGTLDDAEADVGYDVEMAIPLANLSAPDSPASASDGSGSWNINFYVMDKRGDDSQRAVAWSPPMVGDFHVPERFGALTFVVEGEPAAAAAPAGEAAEETTEGAAAPREIEVEPTLGRPAVELAMPLLAAPMIVVAPPVRSPEGLEAQRAAAAATLTIAPRVVPTPAPAPTTP